MSADASGGLYLGLKSYAEADHWRFHGRGAEKTALLRTVRQAPVTVLFGRSGIGKTSLLRAGLFPPLRADGYLPVEIRVDYESGDSGTTQVSQLLAAAVAKNKLAMEPRKEGETLWEHLHRTEVRDSEGRRITPVLVFDQFEELFTVGARSGSEFAKALGDLVENRLPEGLRTRFDAANTPPPPSFNTRPVRIVIALRADFLAHLELLQPSMPSLATNRFALMHMPGDRAVESVRLTPGGKLDVESGVAARIVKFVATGTIEDQEPSELELKALEIEPALLSLVCAELDRKRKGLPFSTGLLKGTRETLISDFLDDCMNAVRPPTRLFIEERLVAPEEYRTPVPLETARTVLGACASDLETLENRWIVRVERRLDKRYVELIHDILIKPLCVRRARRAVETKRDAARKRRLTLAGLGLGLAITVLGVVIAWLQTSKAAQSDELNGKLQNIAADLVTERDSAAANTTWLKREKWTRNGIAALHDGDQATALLCFAQSLREMAKSPRAGSGDPSDVDRLRIGALRLGAANRPIVLAHRADASSVCVSADRRSIATGAADGTARVWDASNGRPITGLLRTGSSPVRVVALSANGARLLTATADGGVQLWGTSEPQGTAECLAQISSDVTWAAFSPDGEWVVLRSADRRAMVWRVAPTPAEPPVLLDGTSGFRTCVFSRATPSSKWGFVALSERFASSAEYTLDDAGPHLVEAAALPDELAPEQQSSPSHPKIPAPPSRSASRPIGGASCADGSVSVWLYIASNGRPTPVLRKDGKTVPLLDADGSRPEGVSDMGVCSAGRIVVAAGTDRVLAWTSDDPRRPFWRCEVQLPSLWRLGSSEADSADVGKVRLAADGRHALVTTRAGVLRLEIPAPVKDADVVTARAGAFDVLPIDSVAAFDAKTCVVAGRVSEAHGLLLWDVRENAPVGGPCLHREGLESAELVGESRVVSRSGKAVRWWDARQSCGTAPFRPPVRLEGDALGGRLFRVGGRVLAVTGERLAQPSPSPSETSATWAIHVRDVLGAQDGDVAIQTSDKPGDAILSPSGTRLLTVADGSLIGRVVLPAPPGSYTVGREDDLRCGAKSCGTTEKSCAAAACGGAKSCGTDCGAKSCAAAKCGSESVPSRPPAPWRDAPFPARELARATSRPVTIHDLEKPGSPAVVVDVAGTGLACRPSFSAAGDRILIATDDTVVVTDRDGHVLFSRAEAIVDAQFADVEGKRVCMLPRDERGCRQAAVDPHEPTESFATDAYATAMATDLHGRIAVADRQRRLRVFDARSVAKPPVDLVCSERLERLTFSADGRWLAGQTSESTIRIWKVADPARPPKECSGSKFAARSARFLGGRMLGAALRGGGILLWDAETGEPVLRATSGAALAESVELLDDASLVAVLGPDHVRFFAAGRDREGLDAIVDSAEAIAGAEVEPQDDSIKTLPPYAARALFVKDDSLAHGTALFGAIDAAEAGRALELCDADPPVLRELDEIGRSALARAAGSGRPRLVEMLLEPAKSPFRRQDLVADALREADLADDIATVLQIRSAAPELARSGPSIDKMLRSAVSTQKTETVRSLLERLDSETRDQAAGEALLAAASAGWTEGVGELLRADADIESRDADGRTPLLAAVQSNAPTRTETVTTLLAQGAAGDARDDAGRTALSIAAARGDLPTAKALVAGGVPIGLRDAEARTVLHAAVSARERAVAEWALDAGVSVDARDQKGNTALAAAAGSGDLEMVRFLLGRHADVDAADETGATPLHAAAAAGRQPLIDVLIDAGASPNATNALRQTPLHVAAESVSASGVRALIARGADVAALEYRMLTPLHLAAIPRGGREAAQALIDAKAALDGRAVAGFTPLHLAVAFGDDAETVTALLAAGAPVNASLDDGSTPLLLSVGREGATLVSDLLGAGANADAPNAEGVTPLISAARRDDASCVRALLNARAAVAAVTRSGIDALGQAASAGKTATMILLIDAAGAAGSREARYRPLGLAVRDGQEFAVEELLRRQAPVDERDTAMPSTPLGRAASSAARGSAALVRTLLAAHAAVDARMWAGQTPLIAAASRGGSDAVVALLEAKASVDAVDARGESALIRAAREGRADVVALLLGAHASADRADSLKRTPLHYAAASGSAQAVRLLLKIAAVRVEPRDASGATPLGLARRCGAKETEDLLRAAGATDEGSAAPADTIVEAAAKGDLGAMAALKAEGQSPGAASLDGVPAIVAAAEEGRDEAVRWLVENGAAVLDADTKGRTLYHAAARGGHVGVLRAAPLPAGTNPGDLPDERGRCPLHWAAAQGSLDVLEWLSTRGGTACPKDRDGRAPLHDAAAAGHDAVVRWLLDQPDVDPNAVDSERNTPLAVATAAGHANVMKTLLGHRRTFATSWGRNPLRIALAGRDSSGVRELLAARLPTVRLDDDGHDALFLAVESGDLERCRLVLAADPVAWRRADDGETALHAAARKGSAEIAQFLLEHGAFVDAMTDGPPGEFGATPLHAAAARGDDAFVRLLLDKGASVALSDRRRRTALHLAAAAGHASTVSLLLEHRARVDARDVDRATPLHAAVRAGMIEVVRVLLADPKVRPGLRDQSGTTALEIATAAGRRDIADLLAAPPK